MTTPASNHQDPTPFGKFLSLLTLLAAALYFTGWIYRWAYYGFFHLEATTLNLPFESFYLAAFQVMFGYPLILGRTISAILITGLVILFALKLWQRVKNWFQKRLLRCNLTSTNTLHFLAGLADELIIVLLITATLFWIAQWQGKADAWRDAVNETSSLPMITVILPEAGAALGRRVDKSLVNPSGFRIIGDRNSYDRLLGQELTNTENTDKPRVWRLLLDRDGYFYIFPTLPKKDPLLSFPVLIIYKSSNPLIILSPNIVKI